MKKIQPSIVVTSIIGLISGIAGASLVQSGTIPPLFHQTEAPSSKSSADDRTFAYVPQSSHEAQITTTVESASPAVVSVIISQDVPIIERYYNELPRSPLDDFFGSSPFTFRIPQLREKGFERREIGGGSGFLVSADGLIVTNRHVVDQSDAQYTVFLQNGDSYNAEVLARDPSNDIAILKISASELPFLSFGNSDSLRVGQSVIAIGNALSEFRNTVSVGVISGLARSITAGNGLGQAEALEQVIQTDAAINPGNSGGPLLNLAGNVIGVNVAVAVNSENIGFALPGNLVAEIVESVKMTGKISRPFLGVRYTPITPTIQRQNNLPVSYGILIVSGGTLATPAVVPGSPADQAGLTEGNIILEVDGIKLNETYSLAQAISSKKVGDTISLKILKGQLENTISATLAETEQ